MKKTFISLFLLSLLTVFGSLSVKADEVLSFVYTQVGYDPGSGTKKYCSGSNADKDKWIADGDFNWNQTTDNVAQREVSSVKWTGVDQAQACTRSDVSFSAANYTLTLLTYRTNHHATMTLPSISINGEDIYASEARWGVSSTETIESNQFNYTNDNGKGAFETEVRLIYHIKIDVANSYGISVSFPSGYDRFKDYVKTLTISQDAPATPTYDVTVNNDGNGTASADKAKYEAGETVTLTAEPNANYLFNGWTTSDDGFSFADEHSASTTFTMPAKAVTVQANFVACSGQTVTVSVNNGTMGSATGGGSYCAGAQVDLEAIPASGYRFVNWTVTSGSASIDNVNSASAHFTMSNPAAAVTVQANFEVDLCSNSLTLEVEDSYAASSDYSGVNYPSSMAFVDRDPSGSGYVSSCHGRGYVNYNGSGGNELIIPIDIPVSGTYKVKAYAGVRKDMYINIYATTSTDQGSITYKSTTYYKQTYKKINDGNNDETFVESDYTDPVSLPSGVCLVGLHGSWSHSAWDQITITRTDGTAFCPNTITMAKSGDDGAAAPTSSPANTAMAGTVVTVTADEPSDANHSFSGWTASPSSVEFANANASSTTFVMPASNVTITANYGAVVLSEFTYTTSGSGSITCATTSGSNVVSGTTIEMTAVPSTDYVFTGWTASAGSFSDASALTTNFTMPAEDAEVTATFAQIDNVISQGSETGYTTSNHEGASMEESHMDDFGAFGHSVLKLSYSNMTGGNYYGWNIGKNDSYSSTNSAGATGFGFYYKTETDADKVAFCFDHGDQYNQYKVELPATNNVWTYHYFDQSAANGWKGSNIIIYINGTDGGNTTANANGAIYLADIAATSITSKPEKANYHYTNDRGGAMQVDEYGTLCLPMAGTISGATLYSVEGKEESDKTYLVLEDKGTSVEAGKPYITQSTATSYTVTMNGPHSAVQAGNGLEGTYELINLPPYDDTHHNYFLYANAFKKAGDNVTVGAYRAYLNWDAVSAAPAQAPSARRIRMVIEGTEAQTGMETVTAMPKTTKVLIDGQLFIIREGKRYTLTGARAQ